MTLSPPTPEEQILFLRNLQRLLSEGQFTATYKFALIHALADLAVVHGDDTGAALVIETPDIAAKFVERYWQQAVRFRSAVRRAGWSSSRTGAGKRLSSPNLSKRNRNSTARTSG
jgi:hypothetical protein